MSVDERTGPGAARTTPGANSQEELWLPFTPNRAFKARPRLISRAEGVTLFNQYGEPLLDGTSGLYCTPAGHAHPKIAEAVYTQMKAFAYACPFGGSHQGAFDLAAEVARLAPEPLNRVFFTNSGSESVDTALKIAMAYNLARGQSERRRFVSRERGYHGVNIGGLSLSGIGRNRRQFAQMMPDVLLMRHTFTDEEIGAPGQRRSGADRAEDLARYCEVYGGDQIAAVFVEPVAGSTGVLPPPVGYLQRLREICDQHGILLVFDEVITGFGRVGGNFGAQRFDVVPDIMTIAKGLTNGAIPMGAAVVKDEIYERIVNAEPAGGVELFHGYTYSGHPAATAAGLAALRIYREEGLFQRVIEGEAHFQAAVHSLVGHKRVKDVRSVGYLAGVELHPEGGVGALGARMQEALFWAGLHMRFTADTGALAPPFIATPAEIERMVEILRKTLDEI